MASENGHNDVAKLLLDYGAGVNIADQVRIPSMQLQLCQAILPSGINIADQVRTLSMQLQLCQAILPSGINFADQVRTLSVQLQLVKQPCGVCWTKYTPFHHGLLLPAVLLP